MRLFPDASPSALHRLSLFHRAHESARAKSVADELELRVDYITRATHKADDLSAAGGITSWILRFTGAGNDDCQTPRRPLTKLGTKLFHQAKRVPEARKTGQQMGRRPQHLLTTRQLQQRQQRSHERHNLSHHGGSQLEMGCFGL